MKNLNSLQPFADFMRPQKLDEFSGQRHLTGAGKIIFNSVSSGVIQSYLFWGPPGVGKTTLAYIIARSTGAEIHLLSSISSNTKQLKEIFEAAEKRLRENSVKTIVFIDEIHRFNKTQQDIFLPYIEKGIIYLISATTENPSFEINSQLLSRVKVLKLKPLDDSDIEFIIRRAIEKKNEWNSALSEITCSEEFINSLKDSVNGDGRQALNILETAFINALASGKKTADLKVNDLAEAAQTIFMNYDKTGEEHFNVISALHKSLRGSDVNASIYWCMRMLCSGDDPLYICRRLIRMATEDVGVADTNALSVALNAYKTFETLGPPEGELAIIEAVIYLASCPKSNSVYTAYNSAKAFIEKDGYRPVPLHICNAPTKLMKDFGYSKGYKYPFEFPYNFVDEKYFPDAVAEQNFYNPSEFGFEKEIRKRIEFWKKLKSK